jgi:hypothetical protein
MGSWTVWAGTQLPPVALGTAPPTTGAAQAGPPSPPFGGELILQDGEDRWAAVMLYDGGSGSLIKNTFIREVATSVDPLSSNVLTEIGRLKEERPK